MVDVPIHLAFPDAALRYSCDLCDQRCCKTSGLAVFPAEHEALIRHHPALELVSPSDNSSIAVFATPPSGCWFLNTGSGLGRCTLFPNNGARTVRPRACTLFPFNLFGTLGEALVVAPNGLCPFAVEPGDGVTHAEVIELLSRLGAAGAPPQPLRSEGIDLVPLERLIRDAATASLTEPSPVPLVAFADLATAAFFSPDADAFDNIDLAPMPEAIARNYDTLELMIAVIGIEEPSPEAFEAVAPTIAAWTPALRLFAFDDLPLANLPTALLGLSLYAAHWQGMRPERPLLPQTLMQMVASLGPTIGLLTVWDQPWTGGRVEGIRIAPGDIPAEVLAGTLGRATADDPEPHRRTLLLRRMADALRPAGEIR